MFARWLSTLLIGAACATGAGAQSAAEHESHHPGAAGSPAPGASQTPPAEQPAATPRARSQAMSGGEGMEQMMEGMMGGGQPEVYPLMMSLPVLSPESRAELERLAGQRIHEGLQLLEKAYGSLSSAIESGDHEAAALALQQVRDGTARLESGVTAHRVTREEGSPRASALQWYKRAFNLAPAPGVAPHGFFGLSWFHYSAMGLVALLAALLVGLQVQKARRVSQFVRKLADAPAARTAQAASRVAAVPGSAPAAVNPDVAPSRSNSWSGPLQVARIFQETPQVRTFRLADPAGGRLPFTYLPGQFLTLTVTPDGRAIKRSYTIASSPTHRDYCEITVRHENLGAVSGFLHERVKEGDRLQVTAPSGRFTFAGQDGDSIVLIAGGVGVTPMMSVIRYLTDRSWPGEIFLVYGCKADDDVIYREELEYLARRYPNLHVRLVAERSAPGWPHATGRISGQLLADTVPGLAGRHVHLCGPPPMMDAVKQILSGLGVPAAQVETEVFIGKERPQPARPAPAPLSPGERPKPPMASFVRSGKSALLSGRTVLEAAEDAGVNIEYSCRVGSCGACKVKLLSGAVSMEVEDGLDPGDKANGLILACQATSLGDVSIDA